MAGSRMEKLGTIFERITGLIKSGAIKKSERPIWYDVYQVFPPKTPPSFANVRPQSEIKPIFYPEDRIRARFHQKMFEKLSTDDLMKETTTDVTRRAIDLTNKLMLENEKLTLEEAVDKTINTFKKEGLFVVRRSMRTSRITDKFYGSQTATEDSKVAESFETVYKKISDKKIDVASLLGDSNKVKKDDS